MNMYKAIKKWYNQGLWSEKAVRSAVTRGWITEEQYREIVEGN
jgi:hypothetical protein